MHTSDACPLEADDTGMISPMRGEGRLNEHAADYVLVYEDGSEQRAEIRRRHQIGDFQRRWGENCFQAVAMHKPKPVRQHHEQAGDDWGRSQTRARAADSGPWTYWLWAWLNPQPGKAIVALRFEPVRGAIVLGGVSYGDATQQPLRWQTRRKLALQLSNPVDLDLDADGLFAAAQIDMGQVISASPKAVYPQEEWVDSANAQLPAHDPTCLILEYTAHPDANLHLASGKLIKLADVASGQVCNATPVRRSSQRVMLRAVDEHGRAVPVRLHVHGEAGEYLAPLDRHRIPNHAWFEDYSVDFSHRGRHYATYIPGETRIDLPLGRVFLEISKGFEIRPIRKVVQVREDTTEITVQLDRVLDWRRRGWVTADTHVHFLSPMSALLEGEAEGINVVNLLASQWGELMTNVGDYDGKTTWGAREAGGNGEYLVRVGTENRQHVLGHISLLGYHGKIIAPMTTGGPDESALGDPIEVLLTEWARQVHKQGGLAILPHFPNPRAEHAASIVEGEIDGVEMTAWGDLYSGISPYSLSDWYRYLNCGYHVPAVGGTDKMDAATAIGTVRTYARLNPLIAFDYAEWMEAIRRGETFVTYGPLLEFHVDEQPMGAKIKMGADGGRVEVEWEVASCTVPMTRVELMINGEVRESLAVDAEHASGTFSGHIDRSSWLALLVRGRHPGQEEMIAAHSSAVMVEVEGSPFFSAADAVTILEQIEGAMAYLGVLGTRAEQRTYQRMRLVLESAHRRLHNRLHQQGYYHEHTPEDDHAEHH